MLRDINHILKNIENQKNGLKGDLVLDARRKEAFYGETLEPLPMPIGHMPYSKSLPLSQLID
jgi:3-mercaptopyruvate sulfurtransferase SseA